MITYVLDASAVLRYLDDEPGVDRMEELLAGGANIATELVISAVQWGEIACKVFQRHERSRYEYILSQLQSIGLTITPATAERAALAGVLRATLKIAYADAFCVQAAMELQGCTLVTADFGFKAAEHLVKIEFLPAK